MPGFGSCEAADQQPGDAFNKLSFRCKWSICREHKNMILRFWLLVVGGGHCTWVWLPQLLHTVGHTSTAVDCPLPRWSVQL